MNKWKIFALFLIATSLVWFLLGFSFIAYCLATGIDFFFGWILIFGAPCSLAWYIGYRCIKKSQLPVKGVPTRPKELPSIERKVPKTESINRKSTKAAFDTSLSKSSNYISEALSIIDSHVDIYLGGRYVVRGAGSEGPVMEATRKFKAAFQLYPENPLLHYAYVSCLHLAMQYKSAEDEMRKCAETHPDFILARLALEGWKKWRSMFLLPPWGIKTKSVHPALSRMIKTGVLLPVRDGIVPRATFFMRDVQGAFQNLQALRYARITLSSVISPVRDPQVIGIYAKIYDDPSNPYDVEVLQIPFRPRGDQIRAAYEYLCIQKNIDFAIIDRNDRILVNKRLPIPRNMQTTNDKIFKMLKASDGIEMSTSQLVNALRRHQQKFSLSDIRY